MVWLTLSRATCSLNLEGLYDPPRALTQQIIYPTPTMMNEPDPTTSAEPASTPAGNAPATAANPRQTYTTLGAQHPESGDPQRPGTPQNDHSSFQATAGQATYHTKPALTKGPQLPKVTEDPSPGHDMGTGVSEAGVTTPTTPGALNALNSAEQTFPTFVTPDEPDHPNRPNSAIPTGDVAESTADTVTFTAQGHTHTIAQVQGSTGVYTIDGVHTIHRGRPAITVNGIGISADSSGQIIAGSRTMTISVEQTPTVNSVIFTAHGEIHTLEPAHRSVEGYVIDGSRTVLADAPPVTLSGLKISIGSSGAIVAGSQTLVMSKSDQLTTSTGAAIEADGQTFSIEPMTGKDGLYQVDGSRTITAGGHAITVNGVTISADLSGDVMANSQTITFSDVVTANRPTSPPRTSLPTVVYPTESSHTSTKSSQANARTLEKVKGLLVWLLISVPLLLWP